MVGTFNMFSSDILFFLYHDEQTVKYDKYELMLYLLQNS